MLLNRALLDQRQRKYMLLLLSKRNVVCNLARDIFYTTYIECHDQVESVGFIDKGPMC